MKTRWDIPLLNQPEPLHKRLLSTELWSKEILRAYMNELEWQKLRRVWELRRSINER